ncbi:hypothetical protein Fot_03684 [Forsythia ovata]|uniref:Uncharacterized protein n=1 Tax=Forsythia ovata TaxID=205694 RepID=A0ABD1XAE1_9LAMI
MRDARRAKRGGVLTYFQRTEGSIPSPRGVGWVSNQGIKWTPLQRAVWLTPSFSYGEWTTLSGADGGFFLLNVGVWTSSQGDGVWTHFTRDGELTSSQWTNGRTSSFPFGVQTFSKRTGVWTPSA